MNDGIAFQGLILNNFIKIFEINSSFDVIYPDYYIYLRNASAIDNFIN